MHVKKQRIFDLSETASKYCNHHFLKYDSVDYSIITEIRSLKVGTQLYCQNHPAYAPINCDTDQIEILTLIHLNCHCAEQYIEFSSLVEKMKNLTVNLVCAAFEG